MADQLPSWTDGQTKAQILEFVRSVTEPGASFVPTPDRVAAFDNDGTLWCEKPMYPQAYFLLGGWKEMVEADPGVAKKQPWKAVDKGDQSWLAAIAGPRAGADQGRDRGLRGITTEAFEKAVRAFFATARAPDARSSLHAARLPPDARADRLARGQRFRRSISAQRAAATSCGPYPRSYTASRGST